MHLIEDKIIYSTSQKEYFKYDLATQSKFQINIEIYCELLFGRYNYKLRSLLEYSNNILFDKIYSTFYQIPDLFIYDREGNLIERKKNFFEGDSPYCIQVNEIKNEIWVAIPPYGVVLCKDIDSAKTKIQIGIPFSELSELSFPEHICIYSNQLFISEMGNRQILKIDLQNNMKSVYETFDEPIWFFEKNDFAEMISLDSGLYFRQNGSKKFIKIID